MRPATEMARLHKATQHRLNKFLKLYHAVGALPLPRQRIILSHIVVEFDNLNIAVLRGFTISTLRRAKTVSGSKVNVAGHFGSEEQIAAYVLSILNPVRYQKMGCPSSVQRKDEASVRDPKETEKILLATSASNLTSLQNALSLNSSLFRDIKFLRHFYAHRNGDTFLKVKSTAINLGLVNLQYPDEILNFVQTGKALPILEEWILEAQIFYELLMQ